MTKTTLKSLIAETIAAARAAGYDEDTYPTYELTREDCESIVSDFGRKPSREEWAAAGHPLMGGAHVFGWRDVTDQQVEALRAEAAAAGDMVMVGLCEAAQDDDEAARAQVVAAITDALAMAD